jgi:hypothetical protein
VIWTATSTAPWLRCVLQAQCKSSKAELVRRLIADDSAWHAEIKFTREKRWPNKFFRRGLAFRAQQLEG